MKISTLFLASTALPLMLLSANASTLLSGAEAPFVLAQAEEPSDRRRLPPRLREGGPGEEAETPTRRREERGQGRQEQRGAGGDAEERSPRPPRGAGPAERGETPDAPPSRRESAPPTERPRARPDQAAPEGGRPPAEERRARPPAQEREQEREREAPPRPRPQTPDAPSRPATPPPATRSTAPPAPAEQRTAPDAARPESEQRRPELPRGQRPAQERTGEERPDGERRNQERPREERQPSRTEQPSATPEPAPTAPTAPAPRTRPTAPAAPSAPETQPTAPTRGETQTTPPTTAPLDPSRVRIEDLRNQRRERREGNRVIIEEPGNRTIIREGNRTIIRHDETDRFRRIYGADDIRVEQRGGGEEVTIVRRRDGSEIITVRDEYGNLIRRIRREPAGQEVILIENRRRGIDRRPGYGYVEEEVLVLPPPQVRIPREEYIVEVEQASQAELVEAFTAPPVERIQRAYTLDEIRRSEPLRERMRRVDLDTINFELGSWELAPDQVGAMTGIAQALQEAISRKPNEIFLIEGHTDAVGSEEDNLTLSDRRAETVATILTERFQIPAENLTTQGYGEEYLKVNTEAPERENRRATIRRITPLLQGQNQQ